MRILAAALLFAMACGNSGQDAIGGDDGSGSGSSADAGTEAPKTVKFIAIGDTGKGNADQRRVAIAMRDLCAAKGCDFVLMLGDNIYDDRR